MVEAGLLGAHLALCLVDELVHVDVGALHACVPEGAAVPFLLEPRFKVGNKLLHVRCALVGDEGDELVSADTVGARLSEFLLHRRADELEHRVTRGVALRVVDLVQAVRIEIDAVEGVRAAVGMCGCLALERVAVAQPGQEVGRAQILDAALVQVALKLQLCEIRAHDDADGGVDAAVQGVGACDPFGLEGFCSDNERDGVEHDEPHDT